MSDIKEDNGFKKQPIEIDKTQKKSVSEEHYIVSSKKPAFLNALEKYPVVFIIIGAIGLLITGILMVNTYKNANSIKELLLPLCYSFIPFIISFLLFRLGIGRLINRNKYNE